MSSRAISRAAPLARIFVFCHSPPPILLRRTGASALPPALREDLFRGRFSGMSLADRLKDAEEKREWKKISEAL